MLTYNTSLCKAGLSRRLRLLCVSVRDVAPPSFSSSSLRKTKPKNEMLPSGLVVKVPCECYTLP